MWNVANGSNEQYFIVDAQQFMLKTTHEDIKAMEAFKLNIHDLVRSLMRLKLKIM